MNTCDNCGQRPPTGLKMCARCQQTRYCSVECQKLHWKKGGHKKACGTLKPLTNTNTNTTTKTACAPQDLVETPSTEDFTQNNASSTSTSMSACMTITSDDDVQNSLDYDPINPCPICLSNEDTFGECGMCFRCGQFFCGDCSGQVSTVCPTCRTSTERSHKEEFDDLYVMVHERSIGRHTPQAHYNISFFYKLGHGVRQSEKRFVKHITLAADQGHLEAQCALCVLYDEPKEGEGEGGEGEGGVKPNRVIAAKYYKMAADQGHRNAQLNLGIRYSTGKGVPANSTLATHYFRLAAEQGDPKAQYNVGIAYYDGTGVASDTALGFKYLKMSAAQGHTRAVSLVARLTAGVQQFVAKGDWSTMINNPEKVVDLLRLTF